tara:strand:+ start:39 stop:362 length:324 start_codon:yes stop_codon:yes gene_type:complete
VGREARQNRKVFYMAQKIKKKKDIKLSKENKESLNEAVTHSVRNYFTELDGQPTTDFYSLVLQQIEMPLLIETMEYTNQNQTLASKILGLNRGTLRTKLRQYKLIDN